MPPSAASTPGPWRVDHDGFGVAGVWQHDKSAPHFEGKIAHISRRNPGAGDDPEREANARLIAAAPDLLAALLKARRAMIVSVTGISDGLSIHDIRDWIAAADAAIAKATGGTL